MKAEVKKIEKTKQFEPFELKIEVETLEEARELWHRFVVNDLFESDGVDEEFHDYPSVSTVNIWKLLEGRIRQFEK